MAYGYTPPVPPGRPPRRGMPTWLLVLLPIGGFFAFVGLGYLGLAWRASHVRRGPPVADAAATAGCASNADCDGGLVCVTRLGSGSRCEPDPSTADACHGISTGSLKVQCHELVRARLEAPLTAKFPSLFKDPPVTSSSDCVQAYSAWVDAKNAYGVPFRHTFVCTYDPKVGSVELTTFE